jgi:hypothetical protein
MICRQILVAAFEDNRPAWGAIGIRNKYFIDGKPWIPTDLGSPFSASIGRTSDGVPGSLREREVRGRNEWNS